MTEKERKDLGIASLPDDLYDAIRITEQSPLVRKALGG